MNLALTDSFITDLVNSKRLIYRFVRILLFLLFAALAIDNFRAGMDSLQERHVFGKDFLQEYLLAVATVRGEDPYQSVSQLEKKFLNIAGETNVFPHATPHPPSLIPYILWMEKFDYFTMASFWMVAEVLMTFTSVFFCWRYLSLTKISPYSLFSFLAFVAGSQVFRSELISGQLNSVLLLLVTGMLIFEDRKKDLLAGTCLGLCLSIKFFGIAFLVFYLLKRKFKLVIVSVLIFLFSLGVSSVLISVETTFDYFISIAPQVSKLYQGDSHNFSPLVLPQRIFEGTHSLVSTKNKAIEPLVLLPSLIEPLKYLLALFLLLVSLLQAVSEKERRLQIPSLIVGSLAVFPNLWEHSLLVLIPVLLPTWSNSSRIKLSEVLILVLFFFGNFGLYFYDKSSLGFWEGLVTLIPTAILIAVILNRSETFFRNEKDIIS